MYEEQCFDVQRGGLFFHNSELRRSRCCVTVCWRLSFTLPCPSLCLPCVQWFLVMGQNSSAAAAAGNYLNTFSSLRFPFNPSILHLCCCGKDNGFWQRKRGFFFCFCKSLPNNQQSVPLHFGDCNCEGTAITSKKFQCERE